MAKNWDFRYAVPKPPEGGVVALSKEELERHLLNRLEQQKDKPDDALADLAKAFQ